MTAPPPPGHDTAPQVRPGAGLIARRVALAALAVVAGLAVLIAAGAVFLNSQPGHRLITRELQKISIAGGLHVKVDRIDGSIYGRMTLRGVAVSDLQGVFLTSPAITVDWSPLALARRHILLDQLSSPQVTLLRKPALKPAAPNPNKPLIPNIYLTIRRLDLASLTLMPPVTGDQRRLSIAGAVDLANGRARLDLSAQARGVDGRPAGDSAVIRLDADPKADRLRLQAHVAGPKGGIIDRLLHLDAPAVFDLRGSGGWRDWRGQARATVGGDGVLNADLFARSGRFRAAGRLVPGRVVKAAAKLADPSLAFDITASMKQRNLQLDARLSSPQMTAHALGGADLGRNLFHDFRLDLRLADPSALSSALSGRDLRLSLRLDGPWASPLVDYDLNAPSLGFGKITAQGVSASGRSQLQGGGTVRIPVHLTASRISGLTRSGGPLTDVRLDGPVTLARNGKVSADLQLRTARMSGRLTLQGSTRTGAYAGSIKASVGAGLVNQLGLGGVLGGPVTLSADLTRSRTVTIGLSRLQLSSPKLRVTQGELAYLANGQVRANLQAVSSTFGPLHLTAGGTLKALNARLSAPNPKLPVPVTGVTAQVTPAPGGGYLITANGASPYGPLSVNAVLQTGKGTMAIDLRRAQLGGLGITGRVVRTAAGPFSGVLRVSGDGLSGAIGLSAAGKAQAADVRLRAMNARLPLSTPVLIRAGTLSAHAVLTPGAPSFRLDADLRGLTRGSLTLARAQAQGGYVNGAGRATVSARGDGGEPFRIAADAQFTRDLIRLTAEGRANGVPFRTQAPAQITRQGGVWRLAPTTLLVRRGELQVSGSYGAGLALQARLNGLDLRLLNAADPSLGVSGKVNGTAQLNLPKGSGDASGRLALQIVGLTRTGATAVSEPVDINVVGALAGAGADADAVMRRGGAVIGRMKAHLAMTPSGPLAQRIRTAQLSGGIRYNGPAEALWSMTGSSKIGISGPIAIGADVSGRTDRPQIRGVVRASDLEIADSQFGTQIRSVAIDGQFAGTRLQLNRLAGTTPGGGTISASGYADLSSANGWPVDVTVELARAQLASSDDLGARVSGTLKVTNSKAKGPLISGDLTVDDARYQVARQGQAQVADLEGVHWKGQSLPTKAQETASSGPPSRWKLDIRVRAPNQIVVNGMGLQSEWSADLHVVGDLAHPMIIGDVRSIRGSYSFAGRRLSLGDSVIHFGGSSPPDPTLNITASDEVNGVTATINIGGTAKNPQISFTSTPGLPEDEVLSQLLFGSSQPSLSPLQALQLASSLNALRGGHGLNPLAKLSRGAGLQNLRIVGPNAATGQGPGLGAGKYITDKIYVDIVTDVRGFTATQVEIALTNALSILSQVSTQGATSGSLSYTHRY